VVFWYVDDRHTISIGKFATDTVNSIGQVVGDRYAFLPYWLVNASVSRNWIFVTPDYRLLPETTAQSSLEDAIDAYSWVWSQLGTELDIKINSVVLAGSSAGGYLALAAAAAVDRKPNALLLIYGMLDPTFKRYMKPGSNIFGGPLIETGPILDRFPKPGDKHDKQQLSAYPLPADIAKDERFPLVSALHIDALFLDYMTGTKGLSHQVAFKGVEAISQQQRSLFPLTFSDLTKLPPTIFLHGKNDTAVPVDLSIRAAEKLRQAGVAVQTEFPDNAEHGFDARAGDVNVESAAGENVTAFQSLRNIFVFLDNVLR
jgi:acetyl esterase/lipase